MTLYHYTCNHGRNGIGTKGHVVNTATHSPQVAAALTKKGWPIIWAQLSWFTDLDVPLIDPLGLTNASISCDRTQYRYRVLDESPTRRWIGSPERTQLHRAMVADLERYGLPMHWWVATEPVAVELEAPSSGMTQPASTGEGKSPATHQSGGVSGAEESGRGWSHPPESAPAATERNTQ